MNGSEVRLGENKRKILIGVAVLVLAGIFALYSYFRVADKDITQDITQDTTQETELVFQTRSVKFSFTPGEVKTRTSDTANLILTTVKLEGRIVSEPVISGDFYEFVVAFPKSDGESVEATVTLPTREDKRIGVAVANDGIIGGGELQGVTHNAIFVSEVTSLIDVGEPIQLVFSLHDVSDELREQVTSHSVCQESPESGELCRASLDEIERWYANNLQFIEAVEGGAELPENHRIGAVQDLMIFND